MSEDTFIARALAGDVLDADVEILDAVEAWHNSDSQDPISVWLGMTDEEYRLWLEQPEFLRTILAARHTHVSLGMLVREASEPSIALAARGVPSSQIAAVKRWLQKTGRL